MKTKLIHYLALILLPLMSIFALGFGCTSSKPLANPLAGFHPYYKVLDQSIVNDYQDYMQKNLSPKEKKNLGPSPVSSFEDDAGQHAIKIRIGINGTDWWHVLIYDKDNKRIKTIKYAAGDYHS